MRIALFGPTALAWWISNAALFDDCPITPKGCSDFSASSDKADNYIKSLFPQLKHPLHYVSQGHHYNKDATWINHDARADYPRDSFRKIESGVFIARPELALMQSCRLLSPHQLLKAAGALCGLFFLDPSATAGLGPRAPLTTKKRLTSYANRATWFHGRTQVLRISQFIPENAASPPEVFLAAALQCPSRLGGFGLPAPTLNRTVVISKRAQRISARSTLIPDLLWKEARVVIEFDSNAVHLQGSQVTRDATKRLALNADGYKVITVTSSQINSRAAIAQVAREVASCLNIRLRQRSSHFQEQNAQLFDEGSSLSFLFQPGTPWA